MMSNDGLSRPFLGFLNWLQNHGKRVLQFALLSLSLCTSVRTTGYSPGYKRTDGSTLIAYDMKMEGRRIVVCDESHTILLVLSSLLLTVFNLSHGFDDVRSVRRFICYYTLYIYIYSVLQNLITTRKTNKKQISQIQNRNDNDVK